MPKQRSHPLDRPFFCETSTQKWAMLFVVLGIVMAIADGLGFIKHPEVFLNYFLAIGTAFIVTAGGADMIRINKSAPKPPEENKDPCQP